LPKRIAGGLSHRLGTPTLRYWGMSATLRCTLREALPRRPAEVPGSRNVEPYTDIDRRR